MIVCGWLTTQLEKIYFLFLFFHTIKPTLNIAKPHIEDASGTHFTWLVTVTFLSNASPVEYT